MKKNIMRKAVAGILSITAIALFFCCTCLNPSKTISIDGINKYEEISSDVPVVLIIDGIDNTIKIKNNTKVKKIEISGINITVYLPRDCYPEIEDDGINTKIIHASN